MLFNINKRLTNGNILGADVITTANKGHITASITAHVQTCLIKSFGDKQKYQ